MKLEAILILFSLCLISYGETNNTIIRLRLRDTSAFFCLSHTTSTHFAAANQAYFLDYLVTCPTPYSICRTYGKDPFSVKCTPYKKGVDDKFENEGAVVEHCKKVVCPKLKKAKNSGDEESDLTSASQSISKILKNGQIGGILMMISGLIVLTLTSLKFSGSKLTFCVTLILLSLCLCPILSQAADYCFIRDFPEMPELSFKAGVDETGRQKDGGTHMPLTDRYWDKNCQAGATSVVGAVKCKFDYQTNGVDHSGGIGPCEFFEGINIEGDRLDKWCEEYVCNVKS